jgi:hypothetical protein
MALILPSREKTAIHVRQIQSAMENLPNESVLLIQEVAVRRRTLTAVSAELGLTEAEAATLLGDAMCSLHDAILGLSSHTPECNAEPPQSQHQDETAWPTRRIPADGEVEAYLAGAAFFGQQGRWLDSVALLVRVADSAKQVRQSPDTANAFRRTGEAFFRISDFPNMAEHHRQELLDSAKACFHDARAVSELINDDDTTYSILCDLATVYFAKGDLSMAKTIAHLAHRLAPSEGNGARQSQRALLFKRTISSFAESREACIAFGSTRAVVAIDVTLSRISIDADRLALAEEYARRALALCVQHKWISQAESIYAVLDEINDLATRADREARMRQLGEHLAKTKRRSTLDADSMNHSVRYVRRDGEFVGTAIAETHNGKLEFWQREAWEIDWNRFEPSDVERREVEQLFEGMGYDNGDIRIDVDELKRRG